MSHNYRYVCTRFHTITSLHTGCSSDSLLRWFDEKVKRAGGWRGALGVHVDMDVESLPVCSVAGHIDL